MLITETKITNFLGIHEFNLAISEPIVMIMGANESGKTSVQEAIRLAMTGRPARVALKKNYADLINRDGKEAMVSIVSNWDGREQTDTFTIKSNNQYKGIPSPNNAPYPLIAVLDPEWLPTLTDKERKDALFKIAGVDVSIPRIESMMKDEQCSDEDIKTLKPFIKSSFNAAMTEAKGKAQEWRAIWKNITGETYGSEKAELWELEAPAAADNENMLEILEKEYHQLIRQEGAYTSQINEVENADYQTKEYSKRVDELEERIGAVDGDAVYNERQETMHRIEFLQKNLKELETTYDRMPKPEEQPEPLLCPYCESRLDYDVASRTLIKFTDANQDIDEGELDRIQETIVSIDSELTELQQKYNDLSEQYNTHQDDIKRLNDLKNNRPPTASDENVDEIKKNREKCRAKQERLSQKIAEQRRLEENRSRARETNAKAKDAHGEVIRWVYLEKLMSPDGIPGKLLAEGVTPLNDAMAGCTQLNSWPPVVIDDEMNITYAGYPYHLLSESARWRVNAMLAYAIASLSGIKTLVLDRIDVLDMPARKQLLNWCHGLYHEEGMSTILFGTLKKESCEKMRGVRDTQCVWLENGRIANG